jgi:hypothetical protein
LSEYLCLERRLAEEGVADVESMRELLLHEGDVGLQIGDDAVEGVLVGVARALRGDGEDEKYKNKMEHAVR